MRKILTLVLLGVIALVATSCRKEIVNRVDPNNYNRTYKFTVESRAWELGGSNTYSVKLPMPEIDKYTHENSAILVYINRYDDNSYEQVPMVYDGYSYSFYHNIGEINIDAQNSSGEGEPERPDLIYVKVVIIDSEPQ